MLKKISEPLLDFCDLRKMTKQKKIIWVIFSLPHMQNTILRGKISFTFIIF